MENTLTHRRTVLAALAAAPLVGACSAENHPVTTDAEKDVYVTAHRVRADGSADEVASVADAVTRFSADIYGRLAAEPGNVACSPYSVYVALAMTLAGAAGTTADELARTLGAGAARTGWTSGLNRLDQELGSRSRTVEVGDHHETVHLESATSLWGQRGTTWGRAFLDTLAADLGAGMHTVDFAHAPAARIAINDWTADRTHDRIAHLLPPGAVDAATRLVLADALWFKAPWAQPFERDRTRDQDFTLRDGSVVQVPTMAQRLDSAPYAAGEGWAAVSLPYAGGELALTVVVPDDGPHSRPAPGAGIADVEHAVGGDGLATLLRSLRSQPVDLRLPRWTTRTSASLRPALQALGVRAAFDPASADFSPMTTDEKLVVGAVEHQAYVAVDESGTEAAAATAVVMAGSTAVGTESVRVVDADRPFVYVVHDVATRTPLFVGRIDDPRR